MSIQSSHGPSEIVDVVGVEATLRAYEAALNASSVADALQLYTEDGVFMSPFSPSAVGIVAVQAAYEHVFSAIQLLVVFHIAEIVLLAPDWAVARTNSAGTCLVHATGTRTQEANQELFILRKSGATWKIARYSFSTTNPPSPGA